MALLASKLFFLTVLLTLTMAYMVMARPLPSEVSLAARLQSDGGVFECWDSLVELRSCTGEVILFFLKGETYLGPSCCRAIGVIEHHCWPSMLGALGFTAEEGDILRGYCDAVPPPPPLLGPSAVVVPNVVP